MQTCPWIGSLMSFSLFGSSISTLYRESFGSGRTMPTMPRSPKCVRANKATNDMWTILCVERRVFCIVFRFQLIRLDNGFCCCTDTPIPSPLMASAFGRKLTHTQYTWTDHHHKENRFRAFFVRFILRIELFEWNENEFKSISSTMFGL